MGQASSVSPSPEPPARAKKQLTEEQRRFRDAVIKRRGPSSDIKPLSKKKQKAKEEQKKAVTSSVREQVDSRMKLLGANRADGRAEKEDTLPEKPKSPVKLFYRRNEEAETSAIQKQSRQDDEAAERARLAEEARKLQGLPPGWKPMKKKQLAKLQQKEEISAKVKQEVSSQMKLLSGSNKISSKSGESFFPENVARISLKSVIGKGSWGMIYSGTVWLVDEPEPRTCAIKQYSDKCLSNESIPGEMEIHMLRKLRHPNIVQYITHHYDSKSRTPYLVTELANGGDLSAMIHGSRGLQYPTVLAVAIQMSSAMNYLHYVHAFVHRDIKPANILVHNVSEGVQRFILCDFGSCRKLVDQSDNLISLAYAAPEVIQGRAVQGSPACDVYSFGVVLLECLTKRKPCPPVVKSEILRFSQRHQVPKEANPFMTSLIKRSLKDDPDKRIKSREIFDQFFVEKPAK